MFLGFFFTECRRVMKWASSSAPKTFNTSNPLLQNTRLELHNSSTSWWGTIWPPLRTFSQEVRLFIQTHLDVLFVRSWINPSGKEGHIFCSTHLQYLFLWLNWIHNQNLSLVSYASKGAIANTIVNIEKLWVVAVVAATVNMSITFRC